MFGVSGSGVSWLWPLYFMQIMKVGVSLAALTVLAVLVAVLDGSNLTLGRRKLMPKFEYVTLSVPTVNSNACSDLLASLATSRGDASLITCSSALSGDFFSR